MEGDRDTHSGRLGGRNVRLPPVAKVVVLIACIVLMSKFLNDWPIPFSIRIVVGFATGVIGGLLLFLSIRNFQRQSTTVDPINPSKAKSLVTDGVFQFTRNPMYVAMALWLITGCMLADTLLGLLTVPAFVWNMRLTQIKTEEAAMTTLFGNDYIAYKQKTPRWVWHVG